MIPERHAHDRQTKKGWLLPYIRQQGWRFAAAAIVGVLAVACAGGLMFTSGYLISRSSLQPYNVLMVYVPIVLVRAFGFGKAVIQYVERLISHDTVLRILAAMRLRLYQALEPQAAHLRSRYQTGDFLGILAEDIEQLQNVYLRLALPATIAVMIYGVGITALGFMDGWFALLIALYCGVLLITVPLFTLIRSRRVRQRFRLERQEMYQEVTDAMFGMQDWILSGRKERFMDAFLQRQSSMLASDQRIRRSEWRAEWIMHLLVGVVILSVTLWAGLMSEGGRIEPEWIAAYAFITFPIIEIFVRAGQAVIAAPDYRLSLSRLRTVEKQAQLDRAALEEEVIPTGGSGAKACAKGSASAADSTAVADPVASTDNGADMVTDSIIDTNTVDKSIVDLSEASSKAEASTKQCASSLDIKNVTYYYTDSPRATLRDVTLNVAAGSRVALLGRSGAGKSTLFKLLQGELVPDEGRILIDEIPAVEARTQHYFSVMNQQPHLFDTSIANNIRLGRADASDVEVRRAANQAGLGSLIDSLPGGINTAVREAGTRFSGGERQRIALARILLQDHPVVLLDEPTVGLDPITERRLIATVLGALQGKTLIWITHHLIGMEQMDRILFMEHGRIVMQGTHEQLLHESHRYRQLYALDQPLA